MQHWTLSPAGYVTCVPVHYRYCYYRLPLRVALLSLLVDVVLFAIRSFSPDSGLVQNLYSVTILRFWIWNMKHEMYCNSSFQISFNAIKWFKNLSLLHIILTEMPLGIYELGSHIFFAEIMYIANQIYLDNKYYRTRPLQNYILFVIDTLIWLNWVSLIQSITFELFERFYVPKIGCKPLLGEQ